MPTSPINTDAIFASDLLSGIQDADTLNGLHSGSFLRSDKTSYPLVDNAYDLGSPTQRFSAVYANSFAGIKYINGIDLTYFLRSDKHNLPLIDSIDGIDGYDFGSEFAYWRKMYVYDCSVKGTLRADIAEIRELRGHNGEIFSHTNLKDIGIYTHVEIDGHINNFTGNVHGATPELKANMIVRRNSAGNIYVNEMFGTALRANYADLAEKYTTDKAIEIKEGLVFEVANDDKYDVEICNTVNSPSVIGVVSEKPGFILNTDIDGVCLGIKGKVKILVKGPVKKGQVLISHKNGIAIVPPKDILNINRIAIANESHNENTIKLIDAII